MLLKYFYDDRLAQASYMVGCAATGEALVVDPARDIIPYMRAAEAEGLRITHVTETHIHADFVSGSRELAAATDATIYLSDEGDADWKYAYAAQKNVITVTDGDMWMVGNIKIEVVHTPGHTPEHISFLVTDTASTDEPMGIFTGDFLFVGDVGRPDLLEEAAGIAGTSEPGARAQFQTIQRISQMADHLQVWPAHGAGSACGKALGAIPSSTLGYEKRVNPAFQFGEDEDAFVNWLLDGQPEAPYYFAQMKTVNRLGPALLSELSTPEPMDRAALDAALTHDDVVIDLRPAADFEAAYVPGTINIPATSKGYINYVGWFVDYDKPLYVVAEADQIDNVLTVLRSIGIDNTPGYFTPAVIDAGATAILPTIDAKQLAERLPQNGTVVLDVRGKSEYNTGHIRSAKNIPLGYIERELAHIPHAETIVTQCASGYRSQIAASLLRKHGYEALNLRDGADVWSQVLETE